jgi:putative chitinase
MIDREKFYIKYKQEFGSLKQLQVDGINTILEEWDNNTDMFNINWLAYMLATVKHETANTFQPIKEYGKGKGRKYGKNINGHIYYGRGFVQLTWDFNYIKLGKILNIDLYNNPDLALDLKNATNIMFIGMRDGLFTGKKLNDYMNDSITNFYQSRKIINGLDKASLIESYAKKFLNCIK